MGKYSWLDYGTSKLNKLYLGITRKQLKEYENLNKLIELLDSSGVVVLKSKPCSLKLKDRTITFTDLVIVASRKCFDSRAWSSEQYFICLEDGLCLDESGRDHFSPMFFELRIHSEEYHSESDFRFATFLSDALELQESYQIVSLNEDRSEMLKFIVQKVCEDLPFSSQKDHQRLVFRTINGIKISIAELYFWNRDQKVIKLTFDRKDIKLTFDRNPDSKVRSPFDVKFSILYDMDTNTLVWAKNSNYEDINFNIKLLYWELVD